MFTLEESALLGFMLRFLRWAAVAALFVSGCVAGVHTLHVHGIHLHGHHLHTLHLHAPHWR